jgi:hypothetical protein
MDAKLGPDNQGIDDMSFKDLTIRAAAMIKPRPADTAQHPAKAKRPKTESPEATPKPKSS